MADFVILVRSTRSIDEPDYNDIWRWDCTFYLLENLKRHGFDGRDEESIQWMEFALASCRQNNVLSGRDLYRIGELFRNYRKSDRGSESLLWLDGRRLQNGQDWWGYWRVAVELARAMHPSDSDIVATTRLADFQIDELVERALTRAPDLNDEVRARLQHWSSNPQRWRISQPDSMITAPSLSAKNLPTDPVETVKHLEEFGARLIWNSSKVSPGDYVDLKNKYGESPNSYALGKIEFRSDLEQQIIVLAGSDEGMQLWLDGELLIDSDSIQEFEIGKHKSSSITLPIGQHAFWIQSRQFHRDWRFGIYIENKDGWPARIDWIE